MDTIELQRVAAIEGDNWWFRERRAVLTGEARRFSAPGAAVDVGAGAALGARVLADHGWHATAIDLSPDAVAAARAHGIEAFEGDARYLPLPGEGYDLALALDVLDHVEDDARAVAELVRVLKPDGTALVSVASDMALWSARDVSAGRVRRYTRRALVDVLEGAGLLVERVWSRGVLVRPVARALRHRMSRRDDLAPLHPALNKALRLSAAAERRLPIRSCPGTSLYARTRRPD